MLPLLELAKDLHEHRLSDTIDSLVEIFALSDSERRALLPSGRQPTFDNRVGWARTYLAKAGLLQSTARGQFKITHRGLEVLNSRPQQVNNEFLMQFQEFQDFRNCSKQGDVEETADKLVSTQTPQEVLEESYQSLRRSLADELLRKVKGCTWQFFERLVVELLVAMGYGGSLLDAGQAVGKSGDDGIDGIIKEDRLGLDVIFLQAKRWDSVVGRPTIQAFAGSLEGQRARKGIFITTSKFTQDAKEYVTRIEKKIVLIDGEQLANLMMDFNVGVSPVDTYVVKKTNIDYFDDAG